MCLRVCVCVCVAFAWVRWFGLRSQQMSYQAWADCWAEGVCVCVCVCVSCVSCVCPTLQVPQMSRSLLRWPQSPARATLFQCAVRLCDRVLKRRCTNITHIARGLLCIFWRYRSHDVLARGQALWSWNMFYAFRPRSIALQHDAVRVFDLGFRQDSIGRCFSSVVVACMCVCMHVCMYVRIYVRMYVR